MAESLSNQPGPQGRAEIRIGGQGFSSRDWVGTFYPPAWPSQESLPFYSRVFDTVELNTTFYAIPSASTIRNWAQRVPEGFVFSAKMPRVITHDKALNNVQFELDSFLNRITLLGGKLGAVVIQFPASFQRRQEERLRAFLALLPGDIRFAVEFRHSSWDHPEILALLRAARVAWCTTHWQDLPPVVELTTDIAYFRLVGFHDEFTRLDEVQHDRTAELEHWAATIRGLAKQVKRIYVYINNHYEGHSPATVNRLKVLLSLPVVEPRSLWTRAPGPAQPPLSEADAG
ncbi:MAG TPA: DUF72 domain-containing protein [Anaerolineae bacterium]|nr:DUF72 domain-containing protein [Anaerolineae bacterium]